MRNNDKSNFSAKRSLKDAKRIISQMEKWLKSDSKKAVKMAEAFFHIFEYHVEHGDLSPENIHLAQLLRGISDGKK